MGHGASVVIGLLGLPNNSMRILRTVGIIPASPLLQCSASRSASFITGRTLRQQYPTAEVSLHHVNDHSARTFTLSTPSQSTPKSSSKNPIFSYRIGASFSAKGRRFNPKKDVFTFNTQTQIPRGQEAFTGRPNSGQDAFFVSRIGNSRNVAFGVADGVGGWANQGIDSADYTHGLCQGMAKAA